MDMDMVINKVGDDPKLLGESTHTGSQQAGTHLESLEAPKSQIFRPAVPGPHRSSPNLTRQAPQRGFDS